MRNTTLHGIGILYAEFMLLTINEVGRCIELVYTPVRNDGDRGSPKSVVSDVIAPGIQY